MMRLRDCRERRRIGTLLVLCQFLLIGWLGFQGVPALTHGNAPAGTWIMGAMGLVLGAWALAANRPGNFNITPNPRPHGHLVTTGLYRWIRHPMYTSVMLCAAAISLAPTVRWQAWLAFAALAAVLTIKSRVEERWLNESHSGWLTTITLAT